MKEVLKDSERQACEIWTRVMGYYRPLSEFNAGKKSEFQDRTYFVYDKDGRLKPSNKQETCKTPKEVLKFYNKVKNFILCRSQLRDTFVAFFTRLRLKEGQQVYQVEIRMQRVGFCGEALTELEALKNAYRIMKINYKDSRPAKQIDIEDILKKNKRKEN